MKNGLKKQNERSLINLLILFLIFFFSLLFWEIVLRSRIAADRGGNPLPFLFFIPAEAMFFTAFTGFHKKHKIVNEIVTVLIMLVVGFYYFAQMIYYAIFGSLFSVSMLGMGGDVFKNFGWAIKDKLGSSPGIIILMALPVFIYILLSYAFGGAAKGYSIKLHIVALLASIALWFAATGAVALFGTGRGSAYYVMKDRLADTDTTSAKIGVLSTTVVEAVSRYLGSADETATMTKVDTNALDMGKQKEVVVLDIQGSAEEQQAAAEEEPVEEDTGYHYKGEAHEWVDESLDLDKIRESTNDKTALSLVDYLESKKPTSTNDKTGMFEGYNLIWICAESFSNYGIDPDITPTLYKMANNGIVLNNFYNSFLNTTTNGEFAFDTGLWPDVSRWASGGTAAGSLAQSANLFMPYGLGDFFDGEGVPTYAYHNYYGDYYKRCYSWPNLGYQNMKFLGKGMNFMTAWPASDLSMMEQSVDDFINEDRFHAYYMTFSGHGPYSYTSAMARINLEKVQELAGDKYDNEEVIGYFCGEYELEKAMDYLLERLEEAGKLDNTVIVMVGDHFPYYLSDAAATELNGGTPLDADFEKYHSTAIIYNAGMEEPIETDTYCCNVDLLPTVLNLMNIPFDSRLLAGTDIFSDGVHRARLYNGSFITDYVKYDKAGDKLYWQKEASSYDSRNLDNYFNAMLDYTESEYSASLNILKSNFFFTGWRYSGKLTDEEIYAEIKREESGQTTYEEEAALALQEEMAKKAEELAQLQLLQKEGQLDEVGAVRMEQLAAEIALFQQQQAAQEAALQELLLQQQQTLPEGAPLQ
ncbi:MAG: sulfatase-like hydrolase/transferase [Lachnospiraceae bacterium]|nr:sulfatase-like hydrolase/transferase [Lachnospiraceae bacterium]